MNLLRPQPTGIFPLPAGYLVLPDTADTAALELILRGELPDELPPEWGFFRLAAHGDITAALNALTDGDPISAYNRFVLNSTPEAYAALQTELPAELLPLLHVVAYTLGYIDMPPPTDDAHDELLAMVLMVQATHSLEQNNALVAAQLLEQAIVAAKPVSIGFAAQLTATLADTQRMTPAKAPFAIQIYKAALDMLEKTALEGNRAECWLNLGMTYHEMANGRRGVLMEAVKCYQQSIRFFTRENYPELYALAQNNLALAYLTMPMVEASDQLRMAIAVQSLKEALKIYTRETHPQMWASAQLNLANALQYLPSTHTDENIVQAVEIYEELLDVRNRNADPVGYARLLANQGNALAHLGIFDHATEKLQDAAGLFARAGMHDAVESIQGVLDQIAAQQGEKDAAT
ncbi:MAG: hypothetical protein AAFU54_25970 [Chloroflexota bacterium]